MVSYPNIPWSMSKLKGVLYKPPPAAARLEVVGVRPSSTTVSFVVAHSLCQQLFMMLILKKVYLESQKVLLFFGDGIRGSLSTVH